MTRLTLAITVIAFCGNLQGQDTLIQFWRADTAANVDYTSFPGQMMLTFDFPEQFTRLPKNPILKPGRGGWDRRDVADPFVVVTADSVYLFYDGNDNDRYHLGYAVLDSLGWGWEKRGMIFSGSGEPWDSYHQIAPVVHLHSNQWIIFYSGNSSDSQLGYQLGRFRFSHSRVELSQKAELILTTTAEGWDFAGINYADLLYIPEENRYRLYYTGFQGPIASIGLAESDDGVVWRKRPEPVLTGLPGVIAPDVLFDGSSFHMFYVQSTLAGRGMRTAIYLSESSDGINWRPGRAVLRPLSGWESGQLMRPHLAFYQQRFYLHYCAGKGRWKIGAAYAVPSFKKSGLWQSGPLPANARRILIRFEEPESTRLMFSWIDSRGKRHELARSDHRKSLRPGVYEGWLDLTGMAAIPGRLEITFETDDPRHSPVLYDLIVQ